MVYEILQIGHPTLRKKATTLAIDEILSDEIQSLIGSMCETMRAAPGVGLAAPQIGAPLQIIVVEDKPDYTRSISKAALELRERIPFPLQVLINPKITEEQVEQVEFFEGCLSIEGYIGVVPRLLVITVEALNEKAEPVKLNARGWLARILQHEIDHLNGILCTDRMKMSTFMSIDNYVQFWMDKPLPKNEQAFDQYPGTNNLQ